MNTQIVHIARDGQEIGAWPMGIIADMHRAGTIAATDHWWIEGMSDWQPMASLKTETPAPAVSAAPTKSPGIAAVLSLVIPGGGHLYVGHYAAGILFFFCFAATVWVMLTLDQLRSANTWIVALLVVAFVVYTVIDSARKAK